MIIITASSRGDEGDVAIPDSEIATARVRDSQ